MEKRPNPVNPKITTEPDLEVPMSFDDLEEVAVKEGIHERIQANIYHENKERSSS